MEKKEELMAKVYSTESFGTVDGPGIRFILFLQGCPLRCKYCHNRDTWNMKYGTEMEIGDILKQIKRNLTYIKASNGGVTVSGGEPLLQAKFVTKFFKELHKIGVHTALDTAGSMPLTQEVKDLLKETDLVILDIKQIDSQKAKELTGQTNENNLNFAKYCSENGNKMWIRQVLIPGYTDDEEDLKKLRSFIDSLKTVERVEILPYHKLGVYKWKGLGEAYPLEGVEPPTEDEMKRAKEILRL